MSAELRDILSAGDADLVNTLGDNVRIYRQGKVLVDNVLAAIVPGYGEYAVLPGGAEVDITAMATIRACDVPCEPKEGDRLVHGGEEYIIAGVQKAQFDTSYHLKLSF